MELLRCMRYYQGKLSLYQYGVTYNASIYVFIPTIVTLNKKPIFLPNYFTISGRPKYQDETPNVIQSIANNPIDNGCFVQILMNFTLSTNPVYLEGTCILDASL